MKGNTQIKLSVIVTLLGVFALAVSTSYAIFNTSKKSDKIQVIQSGAIKLELTEDSGGLSLDGVYPISDEEGLAGDFYLFTVKNTGDAAIKYDIKLLDDKSTTISKKLPIKYIKVGLEQVVNSNTTTSTFFETKKFAVTTPEEQRIIHSREGTLGTGKKDQYKLRLWLADDDESTDIDNYDGYSASFKVKIDARQAI